MQGDEKGNEQMRLQLYIGVIQFIPILYIDCVLDAMHIVFSYFAIADHGKGYAAV